MDFLVRMRPNQNNTLAGAAKAELGLAQLDYWEELEDEHRLVYTAPFVGRRGRVAIYRSDSNDELFRLINRDPLFAYLDRDVIPLTTNDELRALYEAGLGR